MAHDSGDAEMTIPSVPAGPAPGEVLPQQTAGSDEAVEAVAKDLELYFGSYLHGWPDDPVKFFGGAARSVYGLIAARVRAEAVAATAGNREALGRIVRAEWVAWASEQADPKPSWLVPWEQLPEADREVDRRIGQRLYSVAVAEHQADLQHRIEVSTRYENDRRAALAERDEYHRNWQEAEKRTATAVAEAVAEERQRIIELVGDMCTYRDRDGQRLSRPHPASHLGHCPHGEIVQRLLAAGSVPVATPTPPAPGHDAECENTPPKHGTHHCGCRRRRVIHQAAATPVATPAEPNCACPFHWPDGHGAMPWATGPDSAAGPSVGTGTPAETVESMCHWTQGRGNARDESHEEFHYGSPCPYESMAAVLRGEPDPRGLASGSLDVVQECGRPTCVQIAATASEVYCEITGGALSYPTYDARTILAHASDEANKLVESEAAELTEQRDAYADTLANIAESGEPKDVPAALMARMTLDQQGYLPFGRLRRTEAERDAALARAVDLTADVARLGQERDDACAMLQQERAAAALGDGE